MDERQWLEGTPVYRMLEHLGGNVSTRKLRLFACACCRRVWHLLDEACRDAVGVAERFADGEAGAEEMRAARRSISRSMFVGNKPNNGAWAVGRALHNYGWRERMTRVLGEAAQYAGRASADAGQLGEWKAQPPLLRCVFGNPFRPVALDPAWRTPDVVRLAQAAYEERTLPAGTLEPARLALLADALEDAGCANAEALRHLHGPGPHVRGCHVVDLVLGKE